ncbi:MAG: tetratricopeptide repeat protein [Aquabacterium sp.]|nr:tetratricopeptide repeat protein [Aquabacterium sp.]
MNPMFLTAALVLLIVASSFVAWPLWRLAPYEGSAPTPPKRWAAAWLVTVLTFVAVGLYALVGDPSALNPQAKEAVQQPVPTAGAEMGQAQIEGMVGRLAQRLQSQPNDPAGWRMLAKSYETLGRFDQAVHAYQRLLALQQPDPDLLTDYAVTLGMSKDQTLVGEPESLINQALSLNPKHIQALALSGSAGFEKRDYAHAISQWRKLLSLIPADADIRPSIEANLAKAQSLADRDAQATKARRSK